MKQIDLSNGARWIDLLAPSDEEEEHVERLLGIDVPTHDDIRKHEPSSRLYRQHGAIFMAAKILVRRGGETPHTANVAFILKGDTLLTVRYEESRTFDLFATEFQQAETAQSSTTVLAGLIESLVDRTSEILETAADEADDMVARIFPVVAETSKRRSSAELESVLVEIQHLHRRVAKVRESLVSLGRMVGFLLAQTDIKDAEFQARARSTSHDITSVTDHATFVAQNIQFILDTLLGLINVEQNAIVKFFSIVAVVLLPPTLIAAVYGMNFKLMPELHWTWGYPLSILAMLASAVLPYLWCRRRGWL
jgi:magnesium transporter